MRTLNFSEDEADLLKELFNLAMGQAGKSLATFLDLFVDLNPPEIEFVEAESTIKTVLGQSIFSESDNVITFHQHFSNASMKGETIIIFNDNARYSIENILGLNDKNTPVKSIEFMNELANILSGALINNISDRLFNESMDFQKPELIADGISFREMTYKTFMSTSLKWNDALFIKVSLIIKEKPLKCDLLIFFSEDNIKVIKESIHKLMPEE